VRAPHTLNPWTPTPPLPLLLNALKHPHTAVRHTTAWTIGASAARLEPVGPYPTPAAVQCVPCPALAFPYA